MRIAVAGAGLSGLSLCHALAEKISASGKSAEVVLFESEPRTGGKIMSIRQDGYLVEWGPNGFLNNKPDTLRLCEKLGIDGQMLPSNDAARKRFIFAGGVLHRLPETPPAFIKSKLISWPGKLRIMMEPFARRMPEGVDETLADFTRRRLGAEALERLIGPMASGVFAGDPETMSLASCFPRIHELERDYGGLFKAMIKLGRERKKAGSKEKVSTGPGGVLTSFDGGLEVLTNSLKAAFKGRLLLNSPVTKVDKKPGGGFLVHSGGEGTGDGPLITDIFVSAAPAFEAERFLAPVDRAIPAVLSEIIYSSLSVICLGMKKDTLGHDLDGFGFLVGMDEGKKLLGTLWDSSIFPGRAPEGCGSLRSMIGGARDPESVGLTDEELVGITRSELSGIMGLRGVPEFTKVFKHEKAIPQYRAGHAGRLARLDGLERANRGLFFAGNSYRGVGINDCVREAYSVADKVMGLL